MGSPILRKHSETPSVTDTAINPFYATGNVQAPAYPDKILLQVHGELLYMMQCIDQDLCYRYSDAVCMAGVGNSRHLLCIMDEASSTQWRVVSGTLIIYSDYTDVLSLIASPLTPQDPSCSTDNFSLHNCCRLHLCICSTG